MMAPGIRMRDWQQILKYLGGSLSNMPIYKGGSIDKACLDRPDCTRGTVMPGSASQIPGINRGGIYQEERKRQLRYSDRQAGKDYQESLHSM